MTLKEAKKNTDYTIENILTEDEQLSSRFYKLGMYPGAKVLLKRKAPIFSDPMLFQVGESQIALTKEEASLLEVSEK